MSFVRGNRGDLTAYMPPSPSYAGGDYILIKTGAHTYSRYPIGPSLLAVPAVAFAAWINPKFEASIRQTLPDGFEKAIASFYGAVAATLLFWVIFLRFKDLRITLATALIFALGTSMWSTATRALWQHGPLNLMLIITMLLLLAARRRAALAQYAGVSLALSFVMRPTAAIPIAVFSAYIFVCYRPLFGRFIFWAACIAIPWIAYNVLTWGMVLPPYYLLLASGTVEVPGMDTALGEALLGNLISPARGLFIFSPVLIFAISGFWLAMRDRDERPLHLAFALVIVLHWVLVSNFKPWWGGFSFGPRIMTDVLPFLAYFLAFTLQWCMSAYSWRRATATACIAGLAAVSVFIHAQGALRSAPYQWNVLPVRVDDEPARIWDWNDLQFARSVWNDLQSARRLAGIGREPTLKLGRTYHFAPDAAGNDFVADGFSPPEDWGGRWTDGSNASLFFALEAAPPGRVFISIEARSFSSAADRRQEVTVSANGGNCGRLVITESAPRTKVTCPAGALRAGNNAVRFLIAHPTRPIEIGHNDDLRELGLGLRALTIEAEPTLKLGRTYHFAPDAAGNDFVADGFSPPEDWGGRWTDGSNASLSFALEAAPPGQVFISIEARSFSSAADRRQEVTVSANGRNCGRLVITESAPRAKVTCPAGALRAGNNAVRFLIAHPTRPIEIGYNDDLRELGLGLRALTIEAE
jgi:hypothetical protein